jgi:hypothetical protein
METQEHWYKKVFDCGNLADKGKEKKSRKS